MAGQRSVTTLRPLRRSDLDVLTAWLPGVAADAGCESWATDDTLRDAVGRRDVLVAHDTGPAGLLVFETATPESDAAVVRFLAVDPARRRLGIGGRAALALERRLGRTTRRLYVAIPSRSGLALYFWLRLGYRPLTQAEWPARPDDSPATWMLRELS